MSCGRAPYAGGHHFVVGDRFAWRLLRARERVVYGDSGEVCVWPMLVGDLIFGRLSAKMCIAVI
jgi:hypothetical protein